MTYTVLSGTLNSTIPYHTCNFSNMQLQSNIVILPGFIQRYFRHEESIVTLTYEDAYECMLYVTVISYDQNNKEQITASVSPQADSPQSVC